MRHIWLGPNYLVYILDNYEHLDIRITKHLRVLRLNEREIQHRIVLYGCVFLGELLPNILSAVRKIHGIDVAVTLLLYERPIKV